MASSQLQINALEDSNLGAANSYRLHVNDGDKLKNSIAQQWQFKGGWEKWLQNELALFLDNNCKFNTRDGREEFIYAKTGFVDLWTVPYLIDGQTLSQSEALGVELKCAYQNKSVKQGFIEDVAKVCSGLKPRYVAPAAIPIQWNNYVNQPQMSSGGPNGPWLQTKGTTMLCLALTNRPEDLCNLQSVMPDALKTAVQDEPHRFPFYYKKLWTATPKRLGQQWDFHEGPMDLWLMWFESHFYNQYGQIVRY